MAVQDELVQTAQYLRNAAPEQFERFREAFERYTTEAVGNCVLFGTATNHMQGHAQQCLKLRDVLAKVLK